MLWVALIMIYSLMIFSTIMIERYIKKKLYLPQKYKANKRFTKHQKVIEIILVIIAVIGCILANISVYEDGNFHPINPIPLYLWLALNMFLLYGFRGLLARRYAKESNEHYYHFTFAFCAPILLILAFHTTNILVG